MELAELRRQIVGVDRKLFDLFRERMTLIEQVAALKQSSGAPVFVQAQEQRLHGILRSRLPQELWAEAEILLNTLLRLSRGRQYAVLLENVVDWPLGEVLTQAPRQIISVNKVAGPGGLGQVVQQLYPEAVYSECLDADQCLEALVRGGVDLAFFPRPASAAGLHALLQKHRVYIQAVHAPSPEERFICAGSTLTIAKTAERISLVLETEAPKSILPVLICMDRGLQPLQLEQLAPDLLWLDLMAVPGDPQVGLALYQLEKEVQSLHLWGWYGQI